MKVSQKKRTMTLSGVHRLTGPSRHGVCIRQVLGVVEGGFKDHAGLPTSLGKWGVVVTSTDQSFWWLRVWYRTTLSLAPQQVFSATSEASKAQLSATECPSTSFLKPALDRLGLPSPPKYPD